MKIRYWARDKVFDNDWNVGYTIVGERKWRRLVIEQCPDEMQAYIKAVKYILREEKRELKQNLADLRFIYKRLPNPQTKADVAKAKKLLTSVNKPSEENHE